MLLILGSFRKAAKAWPVSYSLDGTERGSRCLAMCKTGISFSKWLFLSCQQESVRFITFFVKGCFRTLRRVRN